MSPTTLTNKRRQKQGKEDAWNVRGARETTAGHALTAMT